MKNQTKSCLGLCTALTLAPASYAGNILVDDFDTVTSGSLDSTQTIGDLVTGDFVSNREMTVVSAGSTNSEIEFGPTTFSTADTNTDLFEIIITYDGFNQVDADLDVSAQTGIQIDFTSVLLSGGGVQVTATLFDAPQGGGGGIPGSGEFTGSLTVDGAQSLFIPFSSNLTPPDPDFTSINEIRLDINPDNGDEQFTVDRVVFTIPEPASMALLGLGTPLLLRRRRN